MPEHVVLDTNIYISAVFWEGNPYKIIQKAINQEIAVYISQAIIAEIKRVLSRDFGFDAQEIDDVIDARGYFAHLAWPKEIVDVVKEDPDDNQILSCALASDSLLIVTQDRHLLKLGTFREILILPPDGFLERFR